MSEPLTLTEVIQTGLDSLLQNIYTALPATVQTYYPSSQTVDATPVVNRPVYDEEGVVTYEALPTIPNIPVVFPRGNGFAFTFPLAKGDTVMLIFSTYAFGVWRDHAQTGQPPGDNRLNSMGYPVAFPGIAPTNAALASATADTMVMGLDNGNAQVTINGNLTSVINGQSNVQVKSSEVDVNTTTANIKASAVNLGSSPTDYVVLANNLTTALMTLTTVFNSHVHPTTSPGAPTGPSPSPMVPPTAAQYAATATKAQ